MPRVACRHAVADGGFLEQRQVGDSVMAGPGVAASRVACACTARRWMRTPALACGVTDK